MDATHVDLVFVQIYLAALDQELDAPLPTQGQERAQSNNQPFRPERLTALTIGHPPPSPPDQSVNDLLERMPEGRQSISALGALDDAVLGQLVETQRKKVRSDTWESRAQLRVPPWSNKQFAHYQKRPAIADMVQRLRNATVLSVGLGAHAVSLKRRYLIFLSNYFIFLSMHLHRHGSHGPPVVLIHGIPGSFRVWREVAEKLATEHLVLIPDLLGFGEGDPVSELDADAQAEALAGALNEAAIDRATIVGHDFGGPVAMSLYSARPELFHGFGLLATNAFPDTPIPFPLSTVNWPVVGDAMARMIFSAPSLKMMLRMYGSSELGNPVSVRAIFTDALQNLQARYERYPAILRDVSVPSLVLWGDRDPFFPVAQGRRLANLLEDVEFEIIERVGHFLPEQRPDAVAASIARLVARADAAVQASAR